MFPWRAHDVSSFRVFFELFKFPLKRIFYSPVWTVKNWLSKFCEQSPNKGWERFPRIPYIYLSPSACSSIIILPGIIPGVLQMSVVPSSEKCRWISARWKGWVPWLFSWWQWLDMGGQLLFIQWLETDRHHVSFFRASTSLPLPEVPVTTNCWAFGGLQYRSSWFLAFVAARLEFCFADLQLIRH